MEDLEIVELYWCRNEQAIAETATKYGNYLTTIARNILFNHEDADECVNDTYLRAWNAMPLHRPKLLRTFLGKVTRNLAFIRYQKDHAQKRGCGEIPLILEEFGDCVSGKSDLEESYDRKLLLEEIQVFLLQQPEIKRRIFLCRYWYAEGVGDIARRFSITENHVSVMLRRLRIKLRQYLLERGFDL